MRQGSHGTLRMRHHSMLSSYCASSAGAADCMCANRTGMCYSDLPLDFAIVGFPKCGTTSLHATLERHPQIALTTSSATLLEDQFWHGAPAIDLLSIRAYDSKLRALRNGDRALVGLRNPTYGYNPVALLRLQLVPRLKLIVLVRAPVPLLLSYYNYRRYDMQHIWPVWFPGQPFEKLEPVRCGGAQPHEYPPTLNELVLGGCTWAKVSVPHTLHGLLLAWHVLPLFWPAGGAAGAPGLLLLSWPEAGTGGGGKVIRRVWERLGVAGTTNVIVRNSGEQHASSNGTTNWCDNRAAWTALSCSLKPYEELMDVMMNAACEHGHAAPCPAPVFSRRRELHCSKEQARDVSRVKRRHLGMWGSTQNCSGGQTLALPTRLAPLEDWTYWTPPATPQKRSVAVCISGQARSLKLPEVWQSQRDRLLGAMHRDGWVVDVFIVLDKPPAASILTALHDGSSTYALRNLSYMHVGTGWRLGTSGTLNQYARFERCADRIRSHEATHSMRYEWVIRSRPDLLFYAELSSLHTLDRTGIHSRRRCLGAVSTPVREEHVAASFRHGLARQWALQQCDGSPGDTSRSCNCTLPSCGAPDCVRVDDTFAVLPRNIAEVYLRDHHCASPYSVAPGVCPCTACSGACLTSQLVAAGARLLLTAFPYTIARSGSELAVERAEQQDAGLSEDGASLSGTAFNCQPPTPRQPVAKRTVDAASVRQDPERARRPRRDHNLSQLESASSCAARGGSLYARCEATGMHYCCNGACSGVQRCASNSELYHCACVH